MLLDVNEASEGCIWQNFTARCDQRGEGWFPPQLNYGNNVTAEKISSFGNGFMQVSFLPTQINRKFLEIPHIFFGKWQLIDSSRYH